ncbi:MAG: YbaB/EbfC family nucleoid-associated protein [Candidatus Fermentithermobacillus carboniphilus]|uniref:Nucleoid-associated protein IMF26_07230 n=1 Tax=Candidatus Fermentithermobacillus carboniphilus TaxID=3085328 RepID=A0AAT9L9Z1_9FIRM|nr:MAG: YbaB/EbfC family nucleoid-associated protein [Candidatus Fermentithermobacillus carboniphilus]
MPRYQGPGGFDMQRLMKEAQKLQAEMARVEEELSQRTVEGTAGGGMVKATVTCSMELKSIEIKKEVVDPDDVEMLQDLIVAAVNAAIAKARETAQEEMSKVTGGLSIPKW